MKPAESSPRSFYTGDFPHPSPSWSSPGFDTLVDMASNLYSLTGYGLAASAAYFVSLAVYRLYVSPLAKFPGPRLAALSNWYEFYYDVVREGQFTWQVQKLHREYGKT